MGRRRSGRKSTRTSECLPKDQNANIPVATNNCDEQMHFEGTQSSATSDSSCTLIESAEENYLSKCNHLNVIGKLSREKIHSAAQLQCCKCACNDVKVAARWLCLHDECFSGPNPTTLCGSKQGEHCHATAHYENNPAHCILWNLRNSRLYCMQCAAEVYKDANYPPLDAEIRRALMPLKRSHRQSSSTPSQEVQNKKEVSHRRTEPTQTRGRCIESFAVVNRPLAKDMEDGFDFDFPKGLTGLFNLGNTCYFNAAIQVLSNCPPFSDYFRDKGDLRPYATREPLVSNTMALLIQKLWSAKREPAVFPKALLTRVRDNFPQFRGWNQQDAQELIRCLLELLHSELGQPVYPHEDYSAFAPKTLERHSSTSSNGSDQFETADSGWSSDGDTTCTSTDSRRSCAEKVEKQKASNMPVRWRSIVTDVFDGSIESSVTCLTCKTVSTTTETFQDLSLPIPSAEHLSRIRQSSSGESDVDDGSASDLSSGYGWIPWFSWLRSFSSVFVTPSVSLEDCLSAFFSPDRLVGDDMYSCDRCKKLRNGVKTCRISRLPEVLCIHIKRFRHDSYCSSKVSTRVSFPLVELDLSPFSSTSEKVPLYDLTGFITHEGSGADSGHYLAYCRNEVDGNWYEYDDSTLTKLDSAHVLTKEAYVLLYQKRPSLSVEAARNKTMEMISAEEIVKAQSKSQLYISSEWLLKLSTFSDPGPVTNYSFLCRHGHLLPRRVDHISSLCTPVPAVLGHYLLNKFGGGPAVSELHYCLVCDKHWRWLQEKRAVEQTRFRQLEDAVRATLFAGAVEALYSGHLPPSLISRTWFQSWEKFISQPCSEPPGPIDNTVLLYKAADGTDRLKPRSNFMRIERELYLFLRTIYGGGPEVFLTDQPQWSEAELRDVLNAVDEKLWAANAKLKKHVTSNL
ncbi:hypothetical protein Y032_0015g2797 [Ancylostoma ceylanicum]|uniref:Ubiquitin carboxyl-terminal hydrolase n=1 Tax=Ancylostoma ceylanicum TaxID=53326 RepID=A0A016VAF4_9BILA|nr:hypothetical protein Y032_0015g2797 [Ancylostoma ceylanicum]